MQWKMSQSRVKLTKRKTTIRWRSILPCRKRQKRTNKTMKVFAHRGFSGRYPQNTMLAFQKALESGCDGIELDVQLTKDGEVVIIHDEYLDDLTDFTGNVRDYTLGELKSCNAGGKWQEAYGFQPIPTFEEYCDCLLYTSDAADE